MLARHILKFQLHKRGVGSGRRTIYTQLLKGKKYKQLQNHQAEYYATTCSCINILQCVNKISIKLYK